MVYDIDERKKIGLGLIGFGFFFSFLGVILFFDRGLLALGNIFSLAGVAILLGWRSTLNVFMSRANYKGSICFFLGLFFIFVRWPILGILLEIYGCIVLFGGFWPSMKGVLYQIPVVGWIIQCPISATLLTIWITVQALSRFPSFVKEIQPYEVSFVSEGSAENESS